MTASGRRYEKRVQRLGWPCRLVVCLLLVALLPASVPFSACQTMSADDEQLRLTVPGAITRGQQYLFAKQSADGRWSSDLGNHAVGVHSLALLSLLASGVDPEQDNVARGLAWLRDQKSPTQVYDISLAIMALAAGGDKQRDFGRVSRLAERLVAYQAASGGWHYSDTRNSFDNSNTQYAMLGLRDAAYFGVEVPSETWRKAEEHWMNGKSKAVLKSEGGDGWGYTSRGNARGSMTVAGISSLAITSMFPQSEMVVRSLDCCGDVEPSDSERAIRAGERWLAKRFSARSNPGSGRSWVLYYLYGLERAGRLSGRRFFGKHDWYREGARFLTDMQLAAGNWVGDGHGENDPVVGTALSLLFLSKGLTPVLVNKLQYGFDVDADPVEAESGPWNTHNYDVRNLVDYLSTQPKWPKLMSWQVVDLRKAAATQDVDALLQAPVQILEGRDNLQTITGGERDLLKEYLNQGGFLFIVRNCEDPVFDVAVQQLIADLVPDDSYQMERLPAGHDVYRAEHLFVESLPDNPVPELYGVDFGCRTAIIYAPYDYGCRWDAWNRRVLDTYARPVAADIVTSMQLGANVLSYATGRELFDKLNAPESVGDGSLSVRDATVPIARLKHSGGWDSAPAALRNLTKALGRFGIDAEGPTPTVSATDRQLFKYPLLYTHGRRNFSLSDEEIEGLENHLANGGLLFADACCGAQAFDKSFRDLVERVTGKPLERIPVDHKIFALPGGYDVTRVRRRQPSASGAGEALASKEVLGEPFLEGVEIDGRLVIIYSKYDISCALERQTTVSCAGYLVDDAVRIATNIVLYSLFQDVSFIPDGPADRRPLQLQGANL